MTFATVAFHDVVDREEDLSHDAITTIELIRFFDWLKGNGWTAISIDDIEAAKKGERSLPPKSVLLTFDDGYQSVYTHVYPLLLAYHYPAVVAVVGKWMEGNAPEAGPSLPDTPPNSAHFLNWPQVREMVASGLVEIASHSYDLHHDAPANPQGGRRPAAVVWQYDMARGTYQDDAAYRQRIHTDLLRSYQQIAREVGRPPRVLVWPYGRYTGPAEQEARSIGFVDFLTLTEKPGNASYSDDIGRAYANEDPKLRDVVAAMEFRPQIAQARRIVCLTLDKMALASDKVKQDEILGQMIDRVVATGADTVVIDAQVALRSAGAPLGSVFFPTTLRPLAADVLARATWQIRLRAGVMVYVRLPVAAARAAVGESKIAQLYTDLLKHGAVDGITLESSPALLAVQANTSTPPSTQPWEINERRLRLRLDPLDDDSRLILTAWRAAALVKPQLYLMMTASLAQMTGRWPAPIADVLLLSPATSRQANRTTIAQLREKHWLDPTQSGRVALTLPPGPLSVMTESLRDAQIAGATAFASCPSNFVMEQDASALSSFAAAFSSETFPLRP